MAEGITKTRECDRAGCRNRKGVAYYEIIMLNVNGDEGPSVSGELCPAHAKMAARFIDNLFKNTKEHPNDPAN